MDVREKATNDKRLIDANKLIDFIDVGHLRNPGELCYSEVDVANILLHAPTVDAVPVVRCKDCRHISVERGLCFCNVWEKFNGMGYDGFCNYGETEK